MALDRKDQDANNNGYPATSYGVPVDTGKYGGAAGTGSGQKEVFDYVWDIDLTDLPTTGEGDLISTLPANSTITSSSIVVSETLSGGTTLDVGLSQPDGTVIDANGLIAGFTNTAVGAYAEDTGAVVGTTVSVDSQLTVTTDRTAGKIRVIVTYKLVP